ncbi:hypothetical protein ABD91_25645 [Lysinibacillus sphaericus]|uniref:hypothetical protein n=1 Tax=Lysinibacillus sphaericus TaxID=1421 RepID=UPI0018CCEE2B|nr:hypothetical protein [Lysinibacillus sphaericus]MBG9694128.1 hypothetical protein [Lysinibacillus sphaericus]
MSQQQEINETIQETFVNQGFNTSVEEIFDKSPLFSDNIYTAEIKPLTPENSYSPIQILEHNKDTLNLLTDNDLEKRHKLLQDFSKSDKIEYFKPLIDYNYSDFNLPEIIVPEELSYDLAIREQGELIVASIAEAVGVIDEVTIPRSYNKAGSKEGQIRNIKWQEVSKYNLNVDVAEKKHPASYIKILIALMMKPIDNDGFLFDVPLKPFAEEVGVSVRTLKTQLINMEKNKHIELINGSLKEAGAHYTHFSFKLERHKDKQHTPGGYISLSKYAYLKLLEIDDVNILRFAIRAYMKISRDTTTAAKKGIRTISIHFSMREIQAFLPSYVGNKPAVQKMIDTLNATGLFNFKFGNVQSHSVVFMTMSPKMFNEIYQNNVDNAVMQTMIHLMNEDTILLRQKDAADIKQMVNQYGLRKILEAINIIKSDLFMINSINEQLYELGALIRITIDQNPSQYLH